MEISSISISIPAYNDAETITQIINESIEVLSKLATDYEIVVINDGSNDSTGEILNNLAKNNKKIKIYHHQKNEGFGKTIKEVFTLPTKEWIFFIPGDAQISPQELNEFYSSSRNYDFILGWRKKRHDSYFRCLVSFVYNLIISLISFNRVHDVNSVAFFRKEIMNYIPMNSQSAFIHAEVYLKSLKKKFRIKEIKIRHNPRISGKSGAIKLKVIFPTIRDLFFYIFGE